MDKNHTMDTLRTISAMLVILLHVSSVYVTNGMNNNLYDLSFWVGNIIDSYSRVCVPLFVLISGMFLIGRNEGFLDSYKNRFSRIMIPLVVWSLLYMVLNILTKYISQSSYKFKFIDFIKPLLFGRPYVHLWYLFMLIGLYFVLPMINKLIVNISNKNLWISAIVFIVFGSVNETYNFIVGNNPIFILWFINYLGYFMIGYLIKLSSKKIHLIIPTLIYIISSSTIAILSYFTAKNYTHLYFYRYLSPFVISGSISIFIIFSQLNIKQNLLSKISHLSFGVYLIHVFILQVVNYVSRILSIDHFEYLSSNPIINILLTFIIVFILSILIVFLLKKNRFLREIV